MGPNVYTMCIQFIDPLTDGEAYCCCDINAEELISSFENINNNIQGYFLIASVGFNRAFFFPKENEFSRTITENIFNQESNFFLEEKKYFLHEIQNIFTSNYMNQIGDNLYSEVYENGKNSNGQYFFINKKKYNFSIYPVILENLYGKKEHILSIIYIYNTDILLSKLNISDTSTIIEIILELILFLVFGFGLLYLIILTFNNLAKYIVIPIKNVKYMLKGINIGGEKRSDFLEYLKKQQDNNLENINNINFMKNKNNILKEKNNNNVDYKKYDEESNFIEKEIQFYDYDESYLQYRSYEVEKIFEILIDLKNAMILTSFDQPVKKIIDYSNSENIFRNIKNKVRASICESNIGNLQMRLLEYDKAIYHLALSLQDNKLKRFFDFTLNDELDKKDSLLNKIFNLFNNKNTKEKANILIEKQQSFQNYSFSHRIIGILINTRYTRLIYAYYNFFKGMKKLKKFNNKEINGQFMDTYFHSIFYYHKTLIQYIFLSYFKNDLIKIGESILDYIEFLIEFKFKTNYDKKVFLNIDEKDNVEYNDKLKIKKDVFDKIIIWFNLFDTYVSYVKGYTSIDSNKNIVDDYSNNFLNETEEGKNKYGYHSVSLFRVNIQRGDFLKGKFALYCKNYNDALFYFIRSAKKNSVITDGIIKKKSLKNIYKILRKIQKKCEKYDIINSSLKQEYDDFDQSENNSQKENISDKNKIFVDNYKYTFNDEIKIILNKVNKDINESNEKEAKDIIILIDFNSYTKSYDDQIDIYSDKIDIFINESKTILENYISPNDRFGLFTCIREYKIICPLMLKYKIDIQSVYDDLINYKNSLYYKDIDILNEYGMNLVEVNENFEIDDQDFSNYYQEMETSSEQSIKLEMNIDYIKGLIDTLNYLQNYYHIKEGITNEKYIILFTDLFNANYIREEAIKNIFENLKENKGVILLIVGKNKSDKIVNDVDKYIIQLIINKFGDKSEIIHFENLSKIKNILSYSNVISDKIIFPNEIYK